MKTSSVLAAAVLAGLAFAAGCSKEKEKAVETPAAAPVAAPVGQAATAFPVEAPDSLRALAKVSLDSASKLALSRVPTGTIAKVELERENSALIWSFDIQVPGRSGISEVHVNAVTGTVSAPEREAPDRPARPSRRP